MTTPPLANGTQHGPPRRTVLTLFGTRPEVIKLAPVIRALEKCERIRALNVTSGQHTTLLYPLVEKLGIRLDHDLQVMTPGQTPNQVLARVLAALDPVLVEHRPAMFLVQGDTTTALAGALAGFHHRVPVGHVEAGLRTDDPCSPFPEEMNRRLITRLATWHFAATDWNRATLIGEGVDPEQVIVTGNPGIDALHGIMGDSAVSPLLAELLEKTKGARRIVLTTHRRESFGEVLAGNLRVLREFVEAHADTALLFPVHPNPNVRGPAQQILGDHRRILLLEPLGHEDFIGLMSRAWLLVSDSGGIQEEAPTLGKPLIVLRENTERPEAVQVGVARLVGNDSRKLRALLEEVQREPSWAHHAAHVHNPFGQGDSGERIASAVQRILESTTGARSVSEDSAALLVHASVSESKQSDRS